MKKKRLWLDGEGGLLLLFFPFTLGFFIYRLFGHNLGLALAPWFIPALLLLLFSGASAYGFLIVPAAFLFFGAFASEALSGMTLQNSFAGEERKAFLTLMPWFPGVFSAAYLGLENSVRLLCSVGSSSGQRLRRCLLISLLQGLILAAAALSAHLIQMI